MLLACICDVCSTSVWSRMDGWVLTPLRIGRENGGFPQPGFLPQRSRVSRSRASGLAASGVPHDGGISDGTSCARSRVPRCRPSFTSQLTAREFFRLPATSFPACHRYARWLRTLSVLRRSCIRFDCRPRFTAGPLFGPGYAAIIVRQGPPTCNSHAGAPELRGAGTIWRSH